MFLLKLQGCEFMVHFQCLPEPISSLDELPGGEDADFYCPYCKNDESDIIGAGKLEKYIFDCELCSRSPKSFFVVLCLRGLWKLLPIFLHFFDKYQIGPNWIKLDQIGSNWIKSYQILKRPFWKNMLSKNMFLKNITLKNKKFKNMFSKAWP